MNLVLDSQAQGSNYFLRGLARRVPTIKSPDPGVRTGFLGKKKLAACRGTDPAGPGCAGPREVCTFVPEV